MRLRISPSPEVQEYVRKQFDTERAGGRIAEADAELVARIRERIEPTQKWLGYE